MHLHIFQCCNNFTDPNAICWSFFILQLIDIPWFHSFSPFISFSTYSFHASLIPFSSTVIFLPDTPFRQFHPVISCLFLPSALPFEKFHFGAQDHSDHLHVPSVSFFCREKNPLCTLPTLLILHLRPFRVFSHPFSVLCLLFPYCCSNLLIPPPCFLMFARAFWHSTCAVLFPSLSFLSYASVHLHPGVSTLLLVPYL